MAARLPSMFDVIVAILLMAPSDPLPPPADTARDPERGWPNAAAVLQATGKPKPEPTRKYVLDYPLARRFCVPVRSFFYQVACTSEMINGRRVIHKPNGSYHYPVGRINGQPVFHLGADVGWHQPESPVRAVAAGVVRACLAPAPDGTLAKPEIGQKQTGRAKSSLSSTTDTGKPKPNAPGAAESSVIIEHRLETGGYFTTIYVHLANRLLVKAGDIVEAGQQIGTIGRKSARTGSRHQPHLHFAVREGRIAEPGCALMIAEVDGRHLPIRLVALTEEEIELDLPAGFSARSIVLAGRGYPITAREGRYFTSSHLLWYIVSRPGFELTGSGLSDEGWRDPAAFLREQGAAP